MDKIATASLKAFGPMPKAGFESPYVTVPAAFLEELIGAIQGLKDEITDLRGIIACQEEKIADLAATQGTQADNQLIQLRLINQLREVATEEQPAPEKSPLIDELYQHMRVVGLKQTTFAGASKILHRSKGRIKQLHPLLAMDQRFIILPSESHKQRLLIRLREFYDGV
jgi:hypothetical protein